MEISRNNSRILCGQRHCNIHSHSINDSKGFIIKMKKSFIKIISHIKTDGLSDNYGI